MDIPATGNRDVYKVNSLVISESSNPTDGHVEWDGARSLWNGGLLA